MARQEAIPLESERLLDSTPRTFSPFKDSLDGTSTRNPIAIDELSPVKRKSSLARLWCSRVVIGIPLLTLSIFGILHIIEALTNYGSSLWDRPPPDDFLPEYGRPGHLGDGLAEYPTDFTRDVIPVPCHSHNDYWRRVPLFLALHYGCTSVEADVWLFPSASNEPELFVGHSTASLTQNRTFRSLYIDPLVSILSSQNPSTTFHPANSSLNGVFDVDPSQTLVLLVDYKNSGAAIHPHVLSQLAPLREKGYLSHYTYSTETGQGQTHYGPITVVATGNAPFDLLTANATYRDVFFDAPLGDMYEEPSSSSSSPVRRNSNPSPISNSQGIPTNPQRRGQGHNGLPSDAVFDASTCYFASVSFTYSIGWLFSGRISARQRRLIRGQIQGAHARGLKVRYWDTPSWPVGVRNHVWQVLVEEGVDYLNADDLRSAVRVDWGRRGHGWV